MGMMEIEVLGVGDAFSARRYNTSFLIHSEPKILIDGPPALFRILEERKIPRQSIGAVIATHIHGDHTAGLQTLLLWRRHYLKKKTRLYTSGRVFKEMEAVFFPAFEDGFNDQLTEVEKGSFSDYVDFVELSEDNSNPLEEGLTVSIRHNWHPVSTLGLKLQSRNSTLGISGDHCYRPRLLKRLLQEGRIDEDRFEKMAGDWLWQADLIYHEASRSEGSPHTQEQDLLELPASIRRKIRLVHVADDFDEGELPVAKEGERFRLIP